MTMALREDSEDYFNYKNCDYEPRVLHTRIARLKIEIGNLIVSTESTEKEYETAIAYYDDALKQNPDLSEGLDEIWNNYGIALTRLGRFQEAIICYNKAIESQPDSHKAWNNKGAALRHLKKPEDAITCYDRALKINPKFHEAWNNRGIALAAVGRLEEAIASYDQALKIKPELSQAWSNRSIAMEELGHFGTDVHRDEPENR